jgi:hypothetical protein
LKREPVDALANDGIPRVEAAASMPALRMKLLRLIGYLFMIIEPALGIIVMRS